MKIKLSRKWWISIGVTIGLLALLGAAGAVVAQKPEPGDPVPSVSSPPAQKPEPGNPVPSVSSPLAPGGGPSETMAFSYQGRLMDGGAPANGNYTFTINLYDNPTVGSPVASCTNVGTGSLINQPVQNGLFTFYLFCGGNNSGVFPGDERWIEVQVAPHGTGITTTLPRQPISPAPYAFSLYPGAVVKGGVSSPSAVTSVTQTMAGSAFAVYGYSAGDAGIYGRGYYDGVRGFGNWSGVSGDGGLIGVEGTGNMYGLKGYSRSTSGEAYGVYGWTNSTSGIGVFGYGKGGSGGKFTSYNGSLIEGWEDVSGDGYSNLQRRFRVSYSGEVYADGGYHCGKAANCWITSDPADFAEVLPAANDPEPGDVLVIGLEGRLARSTEPYQTSVMGVYSTRPMYIGNGQNLDQEGYAPLAVVGLVPVKVSAENGPIRPGDLLTTSSTPGHAMKAGPNPPVGTVIGKALGTLAEGKGVIQMLVTLQ
jgi:hypothetical protein